jgi:uncharacterized protein (UPF0332 family)
MEHKEVLIELWLEKSDKAIEVAENNLSFDFLAAALNRIYYSIFYVVMALAQKSDFKTAKHSTLKGWFNKKFVYQEKIFEPELFDTYKNAFTFRQNSDYDAEYVYDIEDAKTLLNDAKVFIETVKKII